MTFEHASQKCVSFLRLCICACIYFKLQIQQHLVLNTSVPALSVLNRRMLEAQSHILYDPFTFSRYTLLDKMCIRPSRTVGH